MGVCAQRLRIFPHGWGARATPLGLRLPRFTWKLCAMPARHHPDGFVLTAVEKTIRGNNHFAEGQIRKLRNEAAGLRIAGEAAECALRFLPKAESGGWIGLQNISHGLKKLVSPRGCELEFHLEPRAKSASASVSTDSRSNPFPAVISCSPRARRCRSWRSCSLRS